MIIALVKVYIWYGGICCWEGSSCCGGGRSLVELLCDRIMSLYFSVLVCGTLLGCGCWLVWWHWVIVV